MKNTNETKPATMKSLHTLFNGRDFDAMQKIVRAINAHDELVAALKEAVRLVDDLAERGQFFDTMDHQQGLQGYLRDILAKAEGK